MSRMFMPQQTAFSYWRSAHTLISDVEDYKETTILNLTNLGEETQVTIQPYLHPRAAVLRTNFWTSKLVELGEVYFFLIFCSTFMSRRMFRATKQFLRPCVILPSSANTNFGQLNIFHEQNLYSGCFSPRESGKAHLKSQTYEGGCLQALCHSAIVPKV